MPRLVLVVSAFPRLSESFLLSKFRGLLNAGWDAYVVCKRSDDAEWDRFCGSRLKRRLRRRVWVQWPQRSRWIAAALMPAAAVRCCLENPRAVRRYWSRFGFGAFRRIYLDAEFLCLKPDLVHFEFGTLAVGRMDLKDLLDCKVSVSFRGFDLNFAGLAERDYYGEVWREANAAHFLGQDLWKRAISRGCPPEITHALIPPAIDTDFFDAGEREETGAVGTPSRPLRILSVGRLEWKKGYEYALQAVRRLLDSGVACEYRILGGGDSLPSIAFARHQLRLKDAVEFLGPRSRQAVKREMAWADVFLHAAVSEGFCNAVLEAQAMGLPVVTSDADGLPENVSQGETGFVVPRRDPSALAEKLALFAGDPAQRRSMGEAGRRRVATRFRLTDQIAAFDAFYRRILGVPVEARPTQERQDEAAQAG